MTMPTLMTEAETASAEAKTLIGIQRYADAVDLLQRSSKRFPADRGADYLLGLAAYGAEDDKLALAAFRRCLRLDPDDGYAQFGLKMTLRQGHEPAAGRFRLRVRPQLVAMALAPLAFVVVVAALLLRGPESQTVPPPVRLPAIKVGDSPDGVAVARGVVWTANRDGTLTRIDSNTGTSRRIPLGIGKRLDSVAIGGGWVWVTGEADGKVARIDERSASVVDRIAVGGQPKGLAIGAGAAWVANCRDGTVVRIPLRPGSSPSRIPVGGRPRSVAVAAGRVYVAVRPSYAGCGGRAPGAVGHVAVFNAAGTRSPTSLMRVGDPSDLVLTKRWLWVADRSQNRVVRVDPASGDIDAELGGIDRELTSIAADENGVWALSRNEHTKVGHVTRIDPATAERVGNPIRLGGDPHELAVRGGRVWVTQSTADKITPFDVRRAQATRSSDTASAR
jgi:virginiamycin B lyase